MISYQAVVFEIARWLSSRRRTTGPVRVARTRPLELLAWLEHRGGSLENYAFPSRVDRLDHLSTRQYSRLVEEWVSGIGLRKEDYGTHSLRRTKAALMYKQTGNLRAVQIPLGHSKIETTVRYSAAPRMRCPIGSRP